MSFKFEKLEVWQLALDYIDLIYQISEQLPRNEEYNLRSQMVRAATSVALNIAEGSTGQTDAEQARFIGLAIRSLLETVACQRIIDRRGFLNEKGLLERMDNLSGLLAAKLHSFRKTISPDKNWIRDGVINYSIDED